MAKKKKPAQAAPVVAEIRPVAVFRSAPERGLLVWLEQRDGQQMLCIGVPEQTTDGLAVGHQINTPLDNGGLVILQNMLETRQRASVVPKIGQKGAETNAQIRLYEEALKVGRTIKTERTAYGSPDDFM